VGRLACTVAAIVVAMVLVGCEGSSPLAPAYRTQPSLIETHARVTTDPDPEPPAPDRPVARGRRIGGFRFTMYFVAVEPDRPSRREEAPTLAATTLMSAPPDIVSGSPDNTSRASDMTLYTKKGCKPLARVGRVFGKQLDIQGTGKLRDGRVVNTSGRCACPHSPCYKEIKAVWAMGAGGRLTPFRSVAIDTRLIKMGTMLYIPELDGVQMPGKAPWGGFIHDGCVVAADRGGGIAGRELDFFVAKKAYVESLDGRNHLRRINVYDGKGWCEKKDGKVARSPSRSAT
jgi:3D (Asp-Asp-Asp) domain-containing protein